MVLGLQRIIEARDMEPGRFYLKQSYDNEPVIVQCIKTGRMVDDNPVHETVRFAPGTQYPIGFESVPDYGPVVALPDVKVRVDAPSIVSSSASSSIRAGMFLVSGDEAYIAAPLEFRNWALVNLSTGRTVEGQWRQSWISFSRWLLVIEDNGEEIPIASFGDNGE